MSSVDVTSAAWRRTTPLTVAANAGQDACEVWTSPRGRSYELRTRRGKSVDPRRIKGSSEEFAKELTRVRDYVARASERYRFERIHECPICGSSEREPGVKAHSIEYAVCRQCTHAYASRRLVLEDLKAYYAASPEYMPVHANPATAGARIESVANPKVDLIVEQFERVHGQRPQTLLDVGAGAGHIVAAARAKGLKAKGLEPSRVGRDSCRALHGIDLIDSDLPSFVAAAAGSFDVITFWGVLEHTGDPVAQLARARSLLAQPAGMLFVEVPRYECLSTMLEHVLPGLGTRHLEGIEHINCFSDASAATMLETAGFAPSFIWYLGLDWYEFAMRMLYRTREGSVPQFVLDHFDDFQLLNDRAGLADGMIIGATISP